MKRDSIWIKLAASSRKYGYLFNDVPYPVSVDVCTLLRAIARGLAGYALIAFGICIALACAGAFIYLGLWLLPYTLWEIWQTWQEKRVLTQSEWFNLMGIALLYTVAFTYAGCKVGWHFYIKRKRRRELLYHDECIRKPRKQPGLLRLAWRGLREKTCFFIRLE